MRRVCGLESRFAPVRLLALAPRPAGDPAPAGLSIDENAAFDALRTFAANGSGYRVMMGNALDTGGHFAAWGQPELFAAELRAAFRPLRAAQ